MRILVDTPFAFLLFPYDAFPEIKFLCSKAYTFLKLCNTCLHTVIQKVILVYRPDNHAKDYPFSTSKQIRRIIILVRKYNISLLFEFADSWSLVRLTFLK